MAPEEDAEKPADDQTSSAPDEPPEVDAEVVDAEFADEPLKSSATGGAGAESIDPGTAKASGAGLQNPRLFGVTSPFSPGLTVFAAFVAVVVVAVLSFLILRGRSAPPADPAPTVVEKEIIEPSVADDQKPAESTPVQPAAKVEKIVNVIPADTKSALTEAGAADPGASPARGLPAPPQPGTSNEALQEAAKEALRAFGSDDGDAIDIGKPAPATPEPKIEFNFDGSEIVSEETPELSTSNKGGSPIALSDAPTQADEKTGNPFAAGDGVSGPSLPAADIAALRESFERALAERDAHASAEIADLRARLDSAETRVAGPPPAHASLAALALVNLQRAADRGVSYTEELDVFSRLLPGARAVDRLRASAASGAPSLQVLQDRFDAVARSALAAAARDDAKDWFSSIIVRLQQLVSIRPAAPQAGSKPVHIISRAEGALGANDLAGAVRELSALDGAAAEEFSPWLAGARARLGVDEALAALNAALMSELQN